MTQTNTSLRTGDFDFELPDSLIAQQAIEPRDHARLLHVKRGGALSDAHVYDLPKLLKRGDVLVLNDTRVIPARIYGQRGAVKVEVLLHKKESPQSWVAFARPGKRLKVGDRIDFAEEFSATVMDKREGGEILLSFPYDDAVMLARLEKYGEPPLPPYIARAEGAARADKDRYQTIYAARDGAVAAPTAGLHFTPELMRKLSDMGVQIARVTLHVGAGTFLPVKADNLADHKMHSEWFEISQDTAAMVNAARVEGRRVVAVGTTSLRALESAADEKGVVQPAARDTDIFIYPGYKFRVVDALMTNFHLPKSTLFMLVSAFAGQKVMRAAYEYAMKQGYRFYSFGDASLLERNDGF